MNFTRSFCVNASSVPSPHDVASGDAFFSGSSGVFLSGFEPAEVTHDSLFDLTIKGSGLAASQGSLARVKLIKSGETCASVTDATFVRGVACVSGGVCSPAPASGDDHSATFANVKILASEYTDYLVCYCDGSEKCRDSSQYTLAPGVLLARPAIFKAKIRNIDSNGDYVLNNDGSYDTAITRNSAGIQIIVERAQFSTLSVPDSWLLKFVAVATPGHVYSDRSCDNVGANTIVQRDPNKAINLLESPFSSNGWDQSTNQITFDSVVVNSEAGSGNYLVCICEVKDASIEPTASTCDDYQPVMVEEIFPHTPFNFTNAGRDTIPEILRLLFM